MIIGVIGRTAYDSDLCDGQTIKTRVLVDELKNRYPTAKVEIADTYDYKKYPVRMVCSIFKVIQKSQVVFILLSRNGMRVIFPLANFINRFFKRPILHDCIGGSLDELVKQYKGLKKQLLRFEINWVESNRMKEKLEALNICNVEYLPNFKRLTVLKPEDVLYDHGEPFRYCTFSRVDEAKGISHAAEAILAINKKAEHTVACLDVYGPIESGFRATLEGYVNGHKGVIKYKGIVPFDKSVEILKEYYMLLFPTTFYGEGFPGTLLDAFHAGLPVIATNWHMNSEIITHNQTGYLYDPREGSGLEQWIQYSIDNPSVIYDLRLNCLKEAKQYSPDVVMQVICDKIETLIGSVDKSS